MAKNKEISGLCQNSRFKVTRDGFNTPVRRGSRACPSLVGLDSVNKDACLNFWF
jgi:hypothetical protein